MDWALVLASQGIETVLDRNASGSGWELRLGLSDHRRALESIRQYRVESRRFGWRQPVPGSPWSFHWGVLGWMGLCALSFRLQPSLGCGLFDSTAVRSGQWWRAFTALWLHQDLGHLGLNLVFGGIFLGLAMGRYGMGLACLAAGLAGAAGNYFSLALHPEAYTGLGASGMVMGALGLLTAQAVPLWKAGRVGFRVMFSSLAAGASLFMVLGTDPRSDILAHTGGFLAGLAAGSLLAWLPENRRQLLSRVSAVATAATVLLTWILAFKGAEAP